MATEKAPADFSQIDEVWRQIEDLVDQIAELSKTQVPEEQFYAAVLDGAVRAGAAIGGAIWMTDGPQGCQLQYHTNLDTTPLITDEEARRSHQSFLQTVLAADELKSVPPRSGHGGQTDNPTAYLLAACPVAVDGQTQRIVEVEWFGSEVQQKEQGDTVRTVCRHGTTALANALTYSSVPLVRVSKRIRWLASPKRLPKLLIALVAVIALIAVLTLVKSDFYIQCRGQLQPEVRRKVFAPLDGQVERLEAKHGDQVTAGKILATLRSSELEYEYTRVLGEILTTTEQLNAAQASRLGANPTTAAERDEYARLTAEEERLKKSLESLRQQEGLLEEQQAGLKVCSPIEGQVLTWDVAEVLETRPVGRGQVLMTVADTKGPWVLEVQVPDNHIGYVRQARHELKEDLDATFVLATDPGTKYRGTVDKVAMITEPDEAESLSVLVTIAFDRDSVTILHPGAGATARIRCGRRSLGYVWLHDLIEAVRARFFL